MYGINVSGFFLVALSLFAVIGLGTLAALLYTGCNHRKVSRSLGRGSNEGADAARGVAWKLAGCLLLAFCVLALLLWICVEQAHQLALKDALQEQISSVYHDEIWGDALPGQRPVSGINVNGFLLAALALFALVGIGAIVVLLYSRYYRRKINRALTRQSPAKKGALGLNVVWKLTACLVFALCVLSLLIWIGVRQARLTTLEEDLRNQLEVLNDTIESEHNEQYEQLRKEYSLFSVCDFEFTDAALSEPSLTLRFSARPKQASDAVELTLRIAGQTVRLTPDASGLYTGDVVLDPFGASKLDAVLSLDDGVIVHAEPVELRLRDWQAQNFPYLNASTKLASQENRSNNGKSVARLDMNAEVFVLNTPDCTVTDATLLVRSGDTVLREEPLTAYLSGEQASFFLDCSGEYEYKTGTLTEFVLCWKDSRGLRYAWTFQSINGDGMLLSGSYSFATEVYGPDGTRLGSLDLH